MKKIILMMIITTGMCGALHAQSLFPELNIDIVEEEGENSTTATIETTKSNAPILLNNIKAVAEQPVAEEVSEPTDTEETDDESEQESDEQKVYLSMDDINTTLTAVRAVSYCSCNFILKNDTKKTVKDISGTFKIDNQTKAFKFTNVAKGDSLSLKYQIIGTACEHILEQPVVDIQTCQIDGMSEKKCRNKITYLPIVLDQP